MSKWGVAVLAAATLGFETALVRVFSVAHGHHFGFLAISVALLGMGAGGTLLALLPRALREQRAERVLLWAAVGFCATVLGSYALLNAMPFDIYRIAWERVQVAYLVANYVGLALPFLCSGLATGLVLERAERSNVAYAANLLGSAAGALVSLGALALLGGPGAVVLAAALGLVAAALYVRPDSVRPRPGRTARVASLVGAAGLLVLAWLRPEWIRVRLSPYRPLSYALQFPGVRVLSSRWNAYSRVDVLESDAIHVAPGLSLTYGGDVLAQRGLYVDAHAEAPILQSEQRTVASWADHLPPALAYELRPGARALILEPGGGLEVTLARSLGAKRITAVSSNPLVVGAVRSYGGELYVHGDLEVVVRAPRSFVSAQVRNRAGVYDLVDLALNDAQRAVVSGAYTLSEDYSYTVEAFGDYIRLLEPGGLLVVHRWLQTPPSESLRAWALAVTSLEQAHLDPRTSLVAIRSWSTTLILAKKGAFSDAELEQVRAFCERRQFDLVYLPDMASGEGNRFNVYDGAPYQATFRRLLSREDRDVLYREYPYQVRPPTDDRPYYLNFFRWRQVPEIWRALGHSWQPFGGGGYLVLVALLVIAASTSLVLVLLPVSVSELARSSVVRAATWPLWAYFGCLGLGYLSVEIPMIQRLVVFTDHPTVAFVTVVTTMLVGSGIGSLLAPRLSPRWAIAALLAYLAVLMAAAPVVLDLLLGDPLWLRIAVTAALLAPLGLLMGVPFPAGIALLAGRSAPLVPLAWAINGCASVIASILAALIALEGGFRVVVGFAAACYVLAWLALGFARDAES